MTVRRTARARLAVLATLALAPALLVPLAAPAGAATTCTDEAQPPAVPGLPGLTLDGCDDASPPDTVVTPSSAPNAAGFVTTSTMTFTFSAVVTDGDPGPFGFECMLRGSLQQHGWQDCTSPRTYTGLTDSAASSYTFSVRAVDLADAPRNPDNPLAPGTVADTPDLDQTPATVTWGQDTIRPFVYVTPEGYDEETPSQPVVGRDVPIRLNASERGATVECRDNDRPVACTTGRWVLRRAASGRHVFTARSVDAAGNPSEWSPPVEFFVPKDLPRRKGWKKSVHRLQLDGDSVTSRRKGARLVLPRTTVGELRLYAATGPRAGKVRVRVGRGRWQVVNLRGKRSAVAEHIVFDRYSGMRVGRILIEAMTRAPVTLDAIVARPNTFPETRTGR